MDVIKNIFALLRTKGNFKLHILFQLFQYSVLCIKLLQIIRLRSVKMTTNKCVSLIRHSYCYLSAFKCKKIVRVLHSIIYPNIY